MRPFFTRFWDLEGNPHRPARFFFVLTSSHPLVVLSARKFAFVSPPPPLSPEASTKVVGPPPLSGPDFFARFCQPTPAVSATL